jgi:hypothetical protein
MKLYRIDAVTDDGQDTVTKFVGTQAAASAHRKELSDNGFKRKNVTTTELDVPTNKEGLIEFLNAFGQEMSK